MDYVYPLHATLRAAPLLQNFNWQYYCLQRETEYETPYRLHNHHVVMQIIRTSLETQNYSVFGLCPPSGILEPRKHNISETGSVSVLNHRLRLALSNVPN
jgi:hypothetical protein